MVVSDQLQIPPALSKEKRSPSFQCIGVSCLKNKVTLVHAMKAYEECGDGIQLTLIMALDGMSH
jgi:hypothetical protein